MIESPPLLRNKNMGEAIGLLGDPQLVSLFNKIESDHLYWDKVKYYAPEGMNPEILWHALKLKRSFGAINLTFGNLHFHFTVTSKMQQLLHEFDLNFGGEYWFG